MHHLALLLTRTAFKDILIEENKCENLMLLDHGPKFRLHNIEEIMRLTEFFFGGGGGFRVQDWVV